MNGRLYTVVALPPWERASGTHLIGGWVGIRASLRGGGVSEETHFPISASRRETNTGCEVPNLVTQLSSQPYGVLHM
jgi:hypothetical protein